MAALLSLGLPPYARGVDAPQPDAPNLAEPSLRYRVTVMPSGDAVLDQAVKDSAALLKLQSAGGLAGTGLVARARGDEARLVDIMRSLGHYAGSARIALAGRTLDDPDLVNLLDAAAAEVEAVVTLTPGPVFTLGKITLDGDAAGLSIDLHPGDPAVASVILAAAADLETLLRQSGHALAHVQPPVADLDVAGQRVDVTFPVAAGPRVALGPISVAGTERLSDAFVLQHLLVQQGDPYDPAKLEAARADLAKVAAVASVRLIPGEALDAEGRLPVTVRVAERLPRVVSFGGAWSTDQGGSLTASWTHRNLFGNAENLALVAGLTNLAGSAATGAGYRLGARLELPDWRARAQTLSLSALAVRETLDAYDRTALVLGGTVAAPVAERLTASLGVTFTEARITQNKETRGYTLAQLPLGLRYDSTADPLEPISGVRAELVVTPSVSLAARRMGAGGDAMFTIVQATGSAYLDVTQGAGSGRTVVALRANIGSVAGAGPFDLPPDQRFYGGGGGTVRGFRYQSIGPQFASAKPQGGTSLVAATIELRQRIGDSYGAVAFVDAGQVGTHAVPFTGKLQSAGGLGARYYTSIGAIRADIAVPFARPHGADAFEIYLGLGQAF